MREAPWYLKAYTMYDYWVNAKVRGGWSEETKAGRHWGYLVGDFTKLAWFYCVWLLFRKVILVAFLELTDGSLNAGMSLVLQLVDTGMLLFLWPFNDSQTTFVEAVAGKGVGREGASEGAREEGREGGREREGRGERERSCLCVCVISGHRRETCTARVCEIEPETPSDNPCSLLIAQSLRRQTRSPDSPQASRTPSHTSPSPSRS